MPPRAKRRLRPSPRDLMSSLPRRDREYCTIKVWNPSAPMVDESDDIFSPAANRVVPTTLRYLESYIPEVYAFRSLLRWLREAYHYASLHSASSILPRKELVQSLQVNDETASEALWFGCVYLGRMFTSYPVAPTKIHDTGVPGFAYTCAILDAPKNEKASWKIQLGVPIYEKLLNGTTFNIYVGITRKPFANIQFTGGGTADVETHKNLLLEMPAFARILFDDRERIVNAARK